MGAALAARSPGSFSPPKSVVFGGCVWALAKRKGPPVAALCVQSDGLSSGSRSFLLAGFLRSGLGLRGTFAFRSSSLLLGSALLLRSSRLLAGLRGRRTVHELHQRHRSVVPGTRQHAQ